MGFHMLAEVSNLAEGSLAAGKRTLVGFLFRVRHEMVEELCHAVNGFVTLGTIMVFEMAAKYIVFLF